MKKLWILCLSVCLVVFFAGCNNEEADTGQQSDGKETTTTNTETVSTDAEEPHDDETCAFCNMEVYGRTDEMGAFTAQAVTADGEHLFFDDSGCLLNAQRGSEYDIVKEYVRDAQTLDWIEKEDAVVIKSDVKTPMKYGYSFFSSKEEADTYAKEHADEHATISTWEEIDRVSHERYQKKMEQQGDHSADHNQDHEDSSHSDE
ncbi:MAG: nitrous oxide reductase accessory protein NosL [Bacillus sp. (in: firmicutes)]